MSKTKITFQKIKFVFAIGFAAVWAIALTPICIAQRQAPPLNRTRIEKPLIFNAPPPPPDVGAPTQRSQAGSRGWEQTNEQSASTNEEKLLTALVPAYQTTDDDLVWGLTTSESPTFWFYVPYTLTPKYAIEFVLKDDRGNYVYKNKFSGKGTPPGIVSLRLPPTVSLKSDREYAWYFLLYCGARVPDNYINGFIRRVERPNLEKQLRSKTPRERVILYAEQGIWYDALTELAQSHRDRRDNDKLNKDWTSLLQSVG
ncbi:MAG: DUF928 domain-containing protein, partial [Hydrococcus sp. Prado102]|nr:DUF928 domain-containing protein [Hydrococcus sp. Prado102]